MPVGGPMNVQIGRHRLADVTLLGHVTQNPGRKLEKTGSLCIITTRTRSSAIGRSTGSGELLSGGEFKKLSNSDPIVLPFILLSSLCSRRLPWNKKGGPGLNPDHPQSFISHPHQDADTDQLTGGQLVQPISPGAAGVPSATAAAEP